MPFIYVLGRSSLNNVEIIYNEEKTTDQKTIEEGGENNDQ